MRKGMVIGAVLVAAAVVLGSASTYTVGEHEQVVLTQFGEIVGDPVTAPGLHFKMPFTQEVHRFDKRWLEWDGETNRIPTLEKKYIWVDVYARWRIADPIRFYQRMRDEVGAQSRLDDIIDGEIRNAISNHNLLELVRSSSREFEQTEEEKGILDPEEFKIAIGRAEIMDRVQARAAAVMPDFGIELADVQIKRINYTEDVQAKVFERMISERLRIAARYRSEGQGRKAEIMGQIERELKEIESGAYKTAEEIRGQADAEAAAIYAEAYNKDPELYQFLKTLDMYRRTIDENTTVVLSTDAEVLKYLKSER